MSVPFTIEQAHTIAKLQTQFNQGLDEHWPHAPVLKRDDMTAVIVEMGERAEHLGFKWWKQQTPDIEQANMELIDVLHFALSDIIEVLALDGVADPVKEAGDKLYTASCECDARMETDAKWLLRLCAYEGRPEMDRPLAFGDEALRNLMSMLFAAYGDGQNVFVHYIGKNALNHVRQHRGYKEGRYIKMWNEEEDNEVMVRLLKAQRHLLTGEDALDVAVTILLHHYDDNVA